MAKKTSPISSYVSSSGLLEVVSSDIKKNSLTLLCRSVPGKEKEWVDLMEKLLLAFKDTDSCEVHFCRRYILKGDKMVYAWFIEVNGTMETAQGIFNNLLNTAWNKTGVAAPPKSILKGLKGRPPSPAGPDPLPPKGMKMGMTKVKTGKSEKGEQYYEELMPLPHSYKEPEAPGPKNGFKGARKI